MGEIARDSLGSSKLSYPLLDIVKLIMAFFVVGIHVKPFYELPLLERIFEGFACTAVPFFFIASAYLCFQGLDIKDFYQFSYSGARRVRRTIGKLFRLYLIWTFIYIPITVFGSILSGDSPTLGLIYFVRGTFLIGENYFSWPLWYLLAGAVGFFLVYIMLRGGCLRNGSYS